MIPVKTFRIVPLINNEPCFCFSDVTVELVRRSEAACEVLVT